MAFLRPILRIKFHPSGILDGTWFYESSLCLLWPASINLVTTPVGEPQDGLDGTQTNCDGQEETILMTVCAAKRSVCAWEIMAMWDTRHGLMYTFFPDKGRLMITNLVKVFTHCTHWGCHLLKLPWPQCSWQFRKHSAAQRQTLKMISSEGAGFQIAGSWNRETVKDWTSHEKLFNHRLP